LQGASEVQDSAVLSTTARASGLNNGRGRRQALGRGLSGGASAAARKTFPKKTMCGFEAHAGCWLLAIRYWLI
jgi:hypothetical protein